MESLRFSDYCANCRNSLAELERIYFVEREIGRCFCAVECIEEYFAPTAELLHDEIIKLRDSHDYNESDLEKFQKYEELTFQDPDEIWVNQTESGDQYYTYISHFKESNRKFSYVIVCLVLDAKPSYVLLRFVSKDEDLVNHYRKGHDLRLHDGLEPEMPENSQALENHQEEFEDEQRFDLQELERICKDNRKPDDILISDFPKYEPFIELAIEDPDEIWTYTDENQNHFCTFITKFKSEDLKPFTMIVVCLPDVDGKSKELEVVMAFPTIDFSLIQHFRKGINALNKAFQNPNGTKYAA